MGEKKLPELLDGQAIELVYLPTNAFWMNDVERVFADIEKNILANSNSLYSCFAIQIKIGRKTSLSVCFQVPNQQ